MPDGSVPPGAEPARRGSNVHVDHRAAPAPSVGAATPSIPDAAFAAILDDPRTALRPPREGADLAGYRRRLDAPMAAARGPAVRDVREVGVARAGRDLQLRVYQDAPQARGTILFVHGGGFVAGSLDTHDALCRSLAATTGVRVVAVAYRLAPEHPAPAGREDSLAALEWATSNAAPGDPLALCGDSAGGYLAVEVALAAARPVAALGLLYPVVASSCATPSWDAFGDGHVLTRDWMRWGWSALLGAGEASLLNANLGRLPPTRVLTAACDPLRDEGEALVGAIVRAGGDATATRYDGMIHGFASLPALTPRADEAVADLASHFSQHMR